MAIDSVFFTDTDRLAHTDKTFIPTKIPVTHWQLRHYISSPEKDTLYYASGNEIYHVNTVTKKRKHLTTLPFEARCTASGFGYVCVGGEDEGHFAIIKLDTPRTSRNVDVDAPLPIEEYWTAPPAPPPRAANVKIERVGDDIVNSISIHHIQDEEAHLYDIVAVLTNNDRTVRVYSLQQGVETACLALPFPMNHASISPDGQLLVAVGDSNQAFFYGRLQLDPPPQIPKPHNRLTTTGTVWHMTNLVHLRPDPHQRESTQSPGYFTTAWSPSGHLVAVGSEGGQISVFDSQLLIKCPRDEGDDAIVATIPSTRPNIIAHLHPGAVRTIIFSPEPWDLLIWAEDQGRVCIADLRTGLRTKQVIELKPNEHGLNKVVMEDLPPDCLTHDQERYISELEEAYLASHGSTTHASDIIQAGERRRHQQQQAQQALGRHLPSLAEGTAISPDDDPRGLTAREQQILESLRTTRQRAEARSQGMPPRSVNYTSYDLLSNRIRMTRLPYTAPITEDRPFSDVLVNPNDPYTSFPELSRTSQREPDRISADNTLPPLHSIQDFLRLRDRQRDNTPPSSTDQPPTTTTTTTDTRRRTNLLPPVHATRAATTQQEPPSNPTPEPVEPPDLLEDNNNPWRTITRAMTVARGPLFESPRSSSTTTTDPTTTTTTTTTTEQIRRIAAQRDRLRNIRQDFGVVARDNTLYDSLTTTTGLRGVGVTAPPRGGGGAAATTAIGMSDYADLLLSGRRSNTTTTRDVNLGVRTAGLAISGDGRTLWVGCEEGIFEVGINVKGRMVFAAVEMR